MLISDLYVWVALGGILVNLCYGWHFRSRSSIFIEFLYFFLAEGYSRKDMAKHDVDVIRNVIRK